MSHEERSAPVLTKELDSTIKRVVESIGPDACGRCIAGHGGNLDSLCAHCLKISNLVILSKALRTERDAALAEVARMKPLFLHVSEYHGGEHMGHCDMDGGECALCSVLDCPDGEPLHYHHDGCPVCSYKEPTHE